MTKLLQLILLLVISSVFSQKTTLHGKVLSNNKPLEKVHIFNILTSKGVVTDKEGNFFIEVSKGDKLSFSAIPFIKQQVVIT